MPYYSETALNNEPVHSLTVVQGAAGHNHTGAREENTCVLHVEVTNTAVSMCIKKEDI